MTKKDTEDHPLSDFVSESRNERLKNVARERTNNLTVVLDKVRNYHNISAVLRSADAFGLSTVYLIGKEFQYSRTISKGSEKWMRIIRHPNAESAYAELKKEGFKFVVLQAEEINSKKEGLKQLPVYDLPFDEKLALVFGNENLGVSDTFMNGASFGAHIPMFGFVESFNISVACAITLYSSLLGKCEGRRIPQTLNQDEQSELMDTWLRKDVKDAENILKHIELRDNE